MEIRIVEHGGGRVVLPALQLVRAERDMTQRAAEASEARAVDREVIDGQGVEEAFRQSP